MTQMRVADMHCDTIAALSDMSADTEHGSTPCTLPNRNNLRHNTLHLDLERMQKSGYLLQNFALFVNMGKWNDPWSRLEQLYRLYQQELAANADMIMPICRYTDLADNQRAGRMSAMLTVEEGGVCGGDISKLEKLYRMGVRMMTLTWNYPNELGYPNVNGKTSRCFLDDTPDGRQGLTERGFAFASRMEELGMIIDVSHLSDAGFYDVLRCTHKPFVASHSNARAVCGSMRNMTDDMIRKLAERGGCIGLNFCADFLEHVPEHTHNPGTVQAVVRHAKHIVNIGGIEVLGLGSDFDGIDTHEQLPGAQSMGLLWEAMQKDGFSQDELERIFYRNVCRVYREIL